MSEDLCFPLNNLYLEHAAERRNTLENSANMIKTDAVAGKTSPWKLELKFSWILDALASLDFKL